MASALLQVAPLTKFSDLSSKRPVFFISHFNEIRDVHILKKTEVETASLDAPGGLKSFCQLHCSKINRKFSSMKIFSEYRLS